MRNFYCKDCGTLIGKVGSDDIAVKCPKCRALNNSANNTKPPKKPERQKKYFSKMNLAELEAAAKEMGIDISNCKTNKERAAKLTEARNTASGEFEKA